MKKIAGVGMICLILTVLMLSCDDDDDSEENATDPDLVTITDMESYYLVEVDYEAGATSREIGEAYGEQLQSIPGLDLEGILDSYLAEFAYNSAFYTEILSRTEAIKPQLHPEYRAEIEGIAAKCATAAENSCGDGKLSVDEMYILNLFPDVARSTACSALAVYGSRSDNGYLKSARLLDWYEGAQEQLIAIQAVTIIKNGTQSFCSIGYLGGFYVLSGFNDEGVFAGILDSGTRAAFSAKGKYSYPMELRYALEHFDSVDEVGQYMADSAREYTYNHNIFLADATVSKVLENNFSGTGTDMHRALRSASSTLNQGVTWNFSDAVCVVNSFILEGNHDNHTGLKGNTARWQSYQTELAAKGQTVTFDELKEIATYDGANDRPNLASSGDIYNSSTQQIILFEPATMTLEIFFRPFGGLPDDPTFVTVPVVF